MDTDINSQEESSPLGPVHATRVTPGVTLRGEEKVSNILGGKEEALKFSSTESVLEMLQWTV